MRSKISRISVTLIDQIEKECRNSGGLLTKVAASHKIALEHERARQRRLKRQGKKNITTDWEGLNL